MLDLRSLTLAVCISLAAGQPVDAQLSKGNDVIGGDVVTGPPIGIDSLRRGCLALGATMFAPDVPAVGACRPIATTDLGAVGKRRWYSSLFERRWLLSGGSTTVADTVTEREFVILATRLDGGERDTVVVPVWHVHYEVDVLRSMSAEIARQGTDAALIGIDACVNGTGGCSQRFFFYIEGRWHDVATPFLDSLNRRFPGAIAHGFHVDVRTLRASAAVYSPGDANCCPSRSAEMELRLRDNALEIEGLRLIPTPTPGAAVDQSSARFDVPRTPVLTDEVVPIAISGLTRGHPVTITLHGLGFVSRAVFVPDSAGGVDLARMAPKSGYDGVEPMGLFWFAKRETEAMPREMIVVTNPPPEVWQLTAEQDGAVVATDTVLRRAVAPDVRVRVVRESGIIGALYRPPGEERRPAVLVLGGSEGGFPGAPAAPGGLASRGYVVLSLAYFGLSGLPRELRDIPLEYFKRGLDWLAAQPFVDSTRIAVMGASRGAEAALLIGSTYPQVHAVIATSPSNVVVASCCSDRFADAWTLNGSPVRRAEIPVENIRGPLLLISGRDDGVWPSTQSAERIVRRLKEHQFAYPVTNVSFPDAGHSLIRPHSSTMDINARRHPLTGRIVHAGGTPLGTARARESAWKNVLDFLSTFGAR